MDGIVQVTVLAPSVYLAKRPLTPTAIVLILRELVSID
jgi:hypothetical protein